MLKKSIIWIIIIISVTAFALTFIVEFNYINKNNKLQQKQFDNAVEHSINIAIRATEQAETTYIINEILENTQNTADHKYNYDYINEYVAQQNIFSNNEDSIIGPNLIKKPFSITKNETSINKAILLYQNNCKEKYIYTRDLVNATLASMINISTKEAITKRLDPEFVTEELAEAFSNNGITEEFYCAIADKWNKEIYYYNKTKFDITNDCYRQQVGQTDNSGKKYYLYVYFPNQKTSSYYNIEVLAPTFIMTLILLIMYIIALYYISKQNDLHAIKNDFISNMTHELKTPVSSISLAAQMLNDSAIAKSPTILNSTSKVIIEETKRLSRLVDKVLQMTLFEKGATSLKLNEDNVNEVIENIVNTFSLKVSAKGGKIIPQLKAYNAFAEIDEMHFSNVISNLMDNAIKYSKDEVPLILTVTTWNTQTKLNISVKDNGLGIKKDQLKYLFDKFYRAPTGNKHDVKGFGLGLAYVKKIVTDHKGKITVNSEFGVGTEFIISIPVSTSYMEGEL